MGLWWLQSGWTEARCSCGRKIWPEGDPDWGECYDCFSNRIEEEENYRAMEREQAAAMEAEYEEYCEEQYEEYVAEVEEGWWKEGEVVNVNF